MHHVEFTEANQTLTVELLDTSGYENFPAMRELAIRQAQAFILVSAVDEEESFEHVKKLREEILRIKTSQTIEKPPIVVVANKVDLPKKEWSFNTAYAELVVSFIQKNEEANQTTSHFYTKKFEKIRKNNEIKSEVSRTGSMNVKNKIHLRILPKTH